MTEVSLLRGPNRGLSSVNAGSQWRRGRGEIKALIKHRGTILELGKTVSRLYRARRAFVERDMCVRGVGGGDGVSDANRVRG